MPSPCRVAPVHVFAMTRNFHQVQLTDDTYNTSLCRRCVSRRYLEVRHNLKFTIKIVTKTPTEKKKQQKAKPLLG